MKSVGNKKVILRDPGFTSSPVRAALCCRSLRGSACAQGAPGKQEKKPEWTTKWKATTWRLRWNNHKLTTGSVHHLSDWVLCGKKNVAASPATLHRLQVWVAVIIDKVLQQVVLHAEDQRAILPLEREQTHCKYVKAQALSEDSCRTVGFLPSSGSFSSGWASRLERCHRSSPCRSAWDNHRHTSQQCSSVPSCTNLWQASLDLKKKEKHGWATFILLTTLLCMAMHITMSLWPPYTCSRSWD